MSEVERIRQTIDRIQEIRKGNNVHWMDMVRLACDRAPKEALEILKLIVEKDEQVTAEIRKLLEG